MPLDNTQGVDDWVTVTPAAQKKPEVDDWVTAAPQETKKPDDDLPWDVPQSRAQLEARKKADEIAEGLLPPLKPDETIDFYTLAKRAFVRTFLHPAVKGGQSALGERPPPTGTEGLGEAALGASPFGGRIPAEVPGAGAKPRVEPPAPASGPRDPDIDELGLRPAPEPKPAAPDGGVDDWVTATTPPRYERAPDAKQSGDLGEAGLTPTPEPATGTETVAQPQADGTVQQVQVKTGEPPPPPAEPPAPTAVEGASPIGPEFRKLFPDLTDAQFEALFMRAAQEVPGDIPISPAATQSWMGRVAPTMLRLAAEDKKKTEPGLTPEGLAAERDKFAAATPPAPEATPQAAPEEPPSAEPAKPEPVQAFGGPWTPIGKKNHLGEELYENPAGARAILDAGVPWSERLTKDMAPANPSARKRQFQAEGEEDSATAPSPSPSTAGVAEPKPSPPKPATPVQSKTRPPSPESKPQSTSPAAKPAPTSLAEGPPAPGGRKPGTSLVPSIRDEEPKAPEPPAPENEPETGQKAPETEPADKPLPKRPTIGAMKQALFDIEHDIPNSIADRYERWVSQPQVVAHRADLARRRDAWGKADFARQAVEWTRERLEEPGITPEGHEKLTRRMAGWQAKHELAKITARQAGVDPDAEFPKDEHPLPPLGWEEGGDPLGADDYQNPLSEPKAPEDVSPQPKAPGPTLAQPGEKSFTSNDIGAEERVPKAEEAPAPERPKDAYGNPVFDIGDRVVLADYTDTDGRHGVVTNRTGMRTTTFIPGVGAGKTSEVSYHYEVKTDAGSTSWATKLKPETGLAPEFVPDPVVGRFSVTPEQLKRDIESERRTERSKLGAAARARKTSVKDLYRRDADAARATGDMKQRILDKWIADHPEEAAKVFPEAKPAEQAPASTTEAPPTNVMRIVESKHTKTGQKLWVAIQNERTDRAEYERRNDIAAKHGGKYSSFKGRGAIPGFTFPTKEGAEAFVKEVSGQPEKAAEAPPPAVAPPAPEPEPTPVAPEPAAPQTKSWAPEVKVNGKWSRNSLRFATKEEAERSARDLMMRWMAVDDSRAEEADEPPNHRMEDGKLVRLEEPQSLPEITQTAGDTLPPDPEPPDNIDPAVQEATNLAQGKGPELIFDDEIDPEEQEERERDNRRFAALIEEVALAEAREMTENPDLEDQLDLILGMLADGWTPSDIAAQPGIDRTPGEIRALQHHWREDNKLPWEVPNRGIQGALPFGDEGESPEDVPGPGEDGEDGPAPGAEDDGGIRPSGPNPRPAPQGRPRGGRSGGSSGGGRSRKSDDAGLPADEAGPDGDTGATGRPPEPETVDQIKGTNFVIEPGDLGEKRGRAQKARDNIAAIELLQQLKAQGRPATREEQLVLAKYVGWGGLKNAFRDSEGNFGKGMEEIGKRIQELLDPEEYRTAEKSVQYAHYTAEHVVRSMWDAVQAMGFKGGNVFEPGMGIGHFVGLMPPDLAAKTRYRGIEMDHTSAEIAKLLYPRSGVSQADFTRMALPEDAFDLVIGNPPFSEAKILSDPKYAARRFSLHNFFFAKSLDAVRPGGLLAFITSTGTMNNLDPKAREWLAERGEFVGGVRMPDTTFAQNAMTGVTTDMLFFRKHPEGRKRIPEGAMPAWTTTSVKSMAHKSGERFDTAVNTYFAENPQFVLGFEDANNKLVTTPDYAVHQNPGSDLEADLKAALDKLPKNVMEDPLTPEQRAELDFASGQTKDGTYYVKDGKLMQYRGGAGREVPKRGKGTEGGMTAADRDRIIKLIPVRDALREVFKADLKNDEEAGKTARKALNKAYDEFVKWFGPINDAKISYRRPGIVSQEIARQEAREEARFIGTPFYEGDFDDSKMVQAKAKPGEIARARQAAREAALKAGRNFDEGSFVPDDMPDVVIDKRPNIDPFRGDPESYRLRSIENYNEQTGKATKNSIFQRNILTREVEPEINSAQDGVLWSLNKLGRFDVPAIAEKMGKTVKEVFEELADDVYKVPGTEDTFQTKDEYLSGDVVTKLAVAREAAERDPDLRRNVTALEGAQPMPLPPSRIGMVLGMPWIPPQIVEDYARDFLDLGNVRISYSQTTGTWLVGRPTANQGKSWRRQYSGGGEAEGVLKWSTNRRDAYDLLSDALNKTPPRIMTPGSRDNPPQFDPVATRVAQDRMIEMRDKFFNPETRQGWVLQDMQRANDLADIYNSTLNREVTRQHDGSWLKTPGVSSAWSWRSHQMRVIARIILEGNTYMAHAVGSGKTSAMIGAGMEMKRLGLVKKPMYVVPNHMLGQFTKEFYEQYPTARIAVADEAQFHTDVRKQFMANVAQDDLDAVIITHSSFGKIPISDGFQQSMIQEQVEMLTKAISEVGGDRIAVGRLQKQREKLEQKLAKSEGSGKDQTMTFEEMGVDFLFVDEAHQFRKLDFATKQSQMKGIAPEGSNMAWDLFTKVRYLDSVKPGRSAVFASGTPVTNTMGELYTLSRYMQPAALKARGLEHFDSWVQTFCAPKVGLEENAAGGYKAVTRLGKFMNMPELYKMVAQVMDVVTPAQLEQYVTRPKLKDGQRKFHLAPRTAMLDDYQRQLAQRMEAIERRKGPPAKGDDIILSVINDGRHAAIDPRFISKDAANEADSKLNIMLANVAKIYHETTDHQFYDPATGYTKPSFRGPATQMIFSNLGVNPRGPQDFSGYRWMKEQLRRSGIPADEIAIIGDYTSAAARQKLFNDMNEGKIRILIGSTQKMGTGVNAQRRLFAVHNLDPLWFPADDEQRNGRLLRQGNHNPEVEIHDYSTKGTYDSRMWQFMAEKAGFIEQFFRGDPNLRDMEDIGEASMYDQAKAMTTSDERILTLTQWKEDLKKINMRRLGHEEEQWALRQKHKTNLSFAESYQNTAAGLDQDIAKRQDTKGDKFVAMVDGKTYTKRPEAAEALKEAVKQRLEDMAVGSASIIGQIGGFPIAVHKLKGDWQLVLRSSQRPNLSWNDPLSSAEGIIRRFETDRNHYLKQEREAREDAKALEPYLDKPFEGGEDIPRLEQLIEEMESVLKAEADKKTPDAQDEPTSIDFTPVPDDLEPE